MKYAILGMILMLSACVDPVQQEMIRQQREAADNQECVRLGFQPGTEGYGNCRLKLLEIRAMNRQATRVYYEPLPPYDHYRIHRY